MFGNFGLTIAVGDHLAWDGVPRHALVLLKLGDAHAHVDQRLDRLTNAVTELGHLCALKLVFRFDVSSGPRNSRGLFPLKVRVLHL